jgi:hypothetical protein
LSSICQRHGFCFDLLPLLPPCRIAYDLAKLALFDVILLVDDSGSMAFEESGSRITELTLILGKVATACGLLDQDGLSIRFLNSQASADRVTSEGQVKDLIGQIRFTGLTPLGTALDQVRRGVQPDGPICSGC